MFDQVIEDLENRQKESNQPVHVINIDFADNHEDATLGAFLIVDLAQLVWISLNFKLIIITQVIINKISTIKIIMFCVKSADKDIRIKLATLTLTLIWEY